MDACCQLFPIIQISQNATSSGGLLDLAYSNSSLSPDLVLLSGLLNIPIFFIIIIFCFYLFLLSESLL